MQKEGELKDKCKEQEEDRLRMVSITQSYDLMSSPQYFKARQMEK